MLKSKNLEVNIVNYIKNPPSIDELKLVSKKLNLPPKEFLRTKDSKYKELNLDSFKGTDLELFKIINQNPRVLERPIIICNDNAVIGRPPENILKLI